MAETNHILKAKLLNYRRFNSFEISFTEQTTMLIGDNESGKSTILEAIDLAISGSRSRVETIGLEHLLNRSVINDFLKSTKNICDLPEMFVELYLIEQNDPDINGRNNSDNRETDGIKLICQPMVTDYSKEIKDVLASSDDNFPYEYYEIKFKTFADVAFTGYRRFLKHMLLDGAQINNEYAMRAYTREMYRSNAEEKERSKHRNDYRTHKREFANNSLSNLNARVSDYEFSVATDSKSNLEADLTIREQGVPLSSKGKGRQCVLKTEFALQKGSASRPLDILLLEEPENHLSHTNMQKLVSSIANSHGKQLIVTTHSSLISSRLDLRKAVFLSQHSDKPAPLTQLDDSTAKFFVKAPHNNVLELILSSKVLLVEGDAEYILMEKFFQDETGVKPEEANVHILSVGGTSFKRYLEVANLLGIRTGVIRDNDGNYQEKCVDRYKDYISETAKIFYETDNDLNTFEVCIYDSNKAECDKILTSKRQKLSPSEYMIKNKTDTALKLLEKSSTLRAPGYITEAIRWINK